MDVLTNENRKMLLPSPDQLLVEINKAVFVEVIVNLEVWVSPVGAW